MVRGPALRAARGRASSFSYICLVGVGGAMRDDVDAAAAAADQVNQLAESIVNSSEARVGVVDHATRADVELAHTLNHRCGVPYAPHADFELRARRGRVSVRTVYTFCWRFVPCAAPNGRVPSESNGRHHPAR
jgi:hypothetical protein